MKLKYWGLWFLVFTVTWFVDVVVNEFIDLDVVLIVLGSLLAVYLLEHDCKKSGVKK